MPNPISHTLLVLAFGAFIHTAIGQAPIERRPPSPHPSALAEWPTSDNLRPGTLLYVTLLRDPDSPRLCRMEALQEDLILCRGQHPHDDTEYGRSSVASLWLVPGRHTPLKVIEGAAVGGGAASLGLGLLCGVDGGPVCKTPAITGLALLAAGGILHLITRPAAEHPRPIYIAQLSPIAP